MEQEISRYQKIGLYAQEVMCREIYDEVLTHKEKYVISDKLFSVVTSWYSHKTDKGLRPGDTKCLVKRFEPVKDMPGVYRTYDISYTNGKWPRKVRGAGANIRVLTWKKFKDRLLAGGRLQASDMPFPPNTLACADEASFSSMKKSWVDHVNETSRNLLKKSPMMEDYLGPAITDEDKLDAYQWKRWYAQEKDFILGVKHEQSKVKESFSFLVPTGYDDVTPFEDLLVLNKEWKESPLDKNAVVYTYNWEPKNAEEMSDSMGHRESTYHCTATVYTNGEKDCVIDVGYRDVDWDDFKNLINKNKQIFEGHQKAHGKFFPKEVTLFKNEKEFQAFKERWTKEPERGASKSKGIHPVKQTRKELER